MFNISTLRTWLIFSICIISIYVALPTITPQLNNTSIEKFFLSNRVNLGLDLRGGAYLLLEVDVESYFTEQMQTKLDNIKAEMRTQKISYNDVTFADKKLKIELNDADNISKVKNLISDRIGNDILLTSSGNVINGELSTDALKTLQRNLMSQTLEIVRRRVDETGTKEIDLQIQGDNYILLQVPGLDDPNQIKQILGKTAKLAFHMVDDSMPVQEAMSGKIPFGSKVLLYDDNEGDKQGSKYILVKSRAVMSGDMLVDARTALEYSVPSVNFTLNAIGAKIFGELTTKNVGKRIAIVLDGKVISAPAIQNPILGGSSQITGNFSIQSANALALLLRAGALPAPIKIVEERTVGPSLGSDSIEAGKKAVAFGVILVMLFMFLFYGFFGIIANFALIINLFMILAVLALLGATLTLPGIAGMVLTLGMAVDANVLIFERVKEEIRKGRTPMAALESGYKLAFGTIFDSNLTTVLAASVLYIFGTGPVKGFAVTLTIGILCSMFTAISVTKLIIGKWYRKKQPKLLPL